MFDYSWFKVGADTFNDPKIKIIEADENSDIIICIWFKSLCLARIVNDSGYLYINEETPYTLKTLSIEFNRPIEKVKASMKVLRKLQMIELTEDKFYRVKNWTKYQNVDALEKQRAETSKRVARHRAKKKLAKENSDDNNGEKNADGVEENSEEPNSTDNAGKEVSGKDDSDNRCGGSSSNENNEKVKIISNNVPKEIIKENSNGNVTGDKCETSQDIVCERNNSQCSIEGNTNVTNESVTVTDKIKREIKTQTKIENKNESECKSNDDSLNESCARILNYYESITGLVGVLNIGTLKLSIDMHGEKYVKLAIEKAIECGKTNITYINGILKNWKREGYPSEKEEVKVNGGKRNIKSNTADKNEFAGFKPKKPKQLTEEQRKKIEADLI